jgi:hypothetical protein
MGKLRHAAAFTSAALASAFAFGQTATIGLNFTGTDLAEEFVTSFNETGIDVGAIPPDTMGSVGPNHIVELINGHYTVYNKNTGAVLSRSRMHTFWNNAFSNAGTATATTGSFDPRIIYDKHSSRWYAVAVDNANTADSRLLVAVTTGSDPTAASAWRGFTIDADSAGTRWADFPMLGLNASGMFVATNMFDVSGGAVLSQTTSVYGIPKSSLIGATPSISGAAKVENINQSLTGFTMQPVYDLDNGAGALNALSAYDMPNGLLARSVYPSNFFTSPSLDTTSPLISVTPRAAPLSAHQPAGFADNVHTGFDRFSSHVVQRGGHLWAVQSYNAGGRVGIAWYRIDPATDTVVASGTITDPARDLYYPSIAVNANLDVVIGFSASSDTEFISSYAVVGDTTGASTTFGSFIFVKAGVDGYQRLDGIGRNRWGDYSNVVVDPSDENTFWIFQEFVDADRNPTGPVGNVDNNWAVQITSLTIPEPLPLAMWGPAALGGLALRRLRVA